MKKIFPFAAIAIFIICIAGSVLFLKDFDVEISEADVQQAIQSELDRGPISSRGVTLTVNAAQVSFTQTEGARISVDLEAEGYGYAGTIKGDFASQIRYDAPKFYLANLTPITFETAFDTKTQEKIDDLSNIAKDFLKRQKDDMLTEKAKESLDRVVGDNKSKLQELGEEAVYRFFETTPIYDLKKAGLKGSAASLALKDVRFEPGKAVVTLSPLQAILKVLSFLGFLLLLSLGVWFYIFGFRQKGRA